MIALLHHLMGRYLSGKPVLHDLSISGVSIHSQAYVNAMSNTLSQAVKFCFTSTIGVAFAQYFFFWLSEANIDQPNKVWKLDAPLAAAGGNPFTISALPTWRCSPGLAVASLMMLSMIFIPIFVPASIIAVQGELTQPCNISSPDISMAYLAQTYITEDPAQPQYMHNPTLETTAVVNNVITGGSYLPVPSPCALTTLRPICHLKRVQPGSHYSTALGP
ncbi:hypothetical protein K438DRAFT_413179 [Mycena galopus ATCC 62051]|nr:hypothetical protein K438DRAFT_413179 [Mycena galopus ATCC 62051]